MRYAALIALLALLLGVAACGGGDDTTATPETVEGTLPEETTTDEEPASTVEGDASKGEEIFASAGCGGCHALEAAGSSGSIGPNLDESKPDLSLAIDRITNGSGAMPSFKDDLSEQEIADVATYVVESTSG